MYTTMLELAISMVFLYLMLSAASSAIQEIIANLGRWRAKTLEDGIRSLLRDKDVTNGVTKALYDLPLFQGLCSPNARGNKVHKPSYIPSSTFALAMLQLMAPKAGSTDAGQTTLPKETTELLSVVTQRHDNRRGAEEEDRGLVRQLHGPHLGLVQAQVPCVPLDHRHSSLPAR
jgi:hypothetical protein